MPTYHLVICLILVLNCLEGSSSWSTSREPVVAFTAKLSKDTTVRGHGIVKYDSVITNIGRAYNPKSGIFTAPYDGLYTITGTLMSLPSNSVHLRINKNGQKMSLLYSASKTYPQSGQTLHLLLNKGDRIWIQNANPQTAKLHDHGSYNLFSVILVHVTHV
ncbi:complement C1q-like protein 3 [Saccostrea echinata]|uniref:complement C1q-like protein 3 n=1 Tax=Saccostrea echinata TaxID=191078 RepID=UPI002A823506|nr:complement C1q-like protein 3 [Saccostrea echinata]